MTKEVKFKKRYILGEGYTIYFFEGRAIGLSSTRYYQNDVDLKVPDELMPLEVKYDRPKYRLVLERVKP